MIAPSICFCRRTIAAPATLTTCTLAPESIKRSRSSSVPSASPTIRILEPGRCIVGTPVREAVASSVGAG